MKRSALVIAAFCFIGITATSMAEDNTAAANAALIRSHHDALNRGDWSTAVQDFALDTRNFGRPVGRAVVTRILEDIYRTFPDFRLDITDLLTQGDLVIAHCNESGTHRGVGQLPVNGGLLVGVAPTQKRFEVEVVHIYTVRNGKIVDHRGVRDDLGMMQQLGLVTEPRPFDWAKFASDANKP